MALPLVQQDISGYTAEDIIIATPVDLSDTDLDDLSGYTATYSAVQRDGTDTITTAVATIGSAVDSVVTITTVVPVADIVGGIYAHQLSVTDGSYTYIVMVGFLTVEDWLSDEELHYFTLPELRAMDPAFADTDEFPDATLATLRELVEEAIEEVTEVAFVTRTGSARLSGDGSTWLILPDSRIQSITSVSIGGVALTETELAALIIDGRMVYREACWTSGVLNIVVAYTYGYTAVPKLIKRAALLLAKSYAVESSLDPRATAVSTGDLSYRITIAGRDGAFGIPEVDAAIAQYHRPSIRIG